MINIKVTCLKPTIFQPEIGQGKKTSLFKNEGGSPSGWGLSHDNRTICALPKCRHVFAQCVSQFCCQHGYFNKFVVPNASLPTVLLGIHCKAHHNWLFLLIQKGHFSLAIIKWRYHGHGQPSAFPLGASSRSFLQEWKFEAEPMKKRAS